MKKSIKIIIVAIALTILFILLLMNKSTFTSFFSKISGKSINEVAEPVFIMENTEKSQLNDTETEIEYYFNIKNYNQDNKRTQTNLKYYIQIEPIMDSSISFTLYKDGKAINLNNQRTDYIELGKDIDEIHKYKLNVIYIK